LEKNVEKISSLMNDSRLKGKSKELDRLASTPEGAAAQRYAQNNEAELRKALETNDEQGVKNILQNFLSTPEGSKLAAEFLDLFK